MSWSNTERGPGVSDSQVSSPANVLIYGGSFDPIHHGHLKTAVNIQNFFHFDHVKFLPCKLSPIPKPSQFTASPQDRVEMLKRALTAYPHSYHFEIDGREIQRQTPSYTVTTLMAYRKELGEETPITLVLGVDALHQLPQWHQWEKLIHLANFLVINRSSYPDKTITMPEAIKNLVEQHETRDPKALLTTAHGLIYHFDAGNFEISSSLIRKLHQENKELTPFLPQAVIDYLIEKKLY